MSEVLYGFVRTILRRHGSCVWRFAAATCVQAARSASCLPSPSVTNPTFSKMMATMSAVAPARASVSVRGRPAPVSRATIARPAKVRRARALRRARLRSRARAAGPRRAGRGRQREAGVRGFAVWRGARLSLLRARSASSKGGEEGGVKFDRSCFGIVASNANYVTLGSAIQKARVPPHPPCAVPLRATWLCGAVGCPSARKPGARPCILPAGAVRGLHRPRAQALQA